MENQTKTHTLIIIEWLTLAAIFVSCFFFLHTEISSLSCRMEARTDNLYVMFVDMRKDMDQMRKESDQKFYDMRKDMDQMRKESDQKFYDLLKEQKSKS